MNSFTKYEFFFPKKIYCCPCIMNPAEQSFQSGEHSLADIFIWSGTLNTIFLCYAKIFFAQKLEKKEDCLIISQANLAIVLLSTRKFLCTSDDEDTVRIRSNQKEEVFGRGCVKQYMRQRYSYFYFVNFEL